MKYFFKFLMIMTRKGNLMPSVFFGSAGHVIYVVLETTEKNSIRHRYLMGVAMVTLMSGLVFKKLQILTFKDTLPTMIFNV